MEPIAITTFFQYLAGTLLTAGLSLFFHACMGEGMIFNTYLLFLYRMEDKLAKNWQKAFLKPLGLCIYCSSTWIAIAVYILYFGLSLEILFFLGLNYLWIKILNKL